MSAMEQIEKIVESVFDPKSATMRQFKESVMANKELSSLLVSGLKSVVSVKTGSEETVVVRKPRAVIKPKDDGVRCQALVWMLEKDAEGNWVPQRCTRGCEEGSGFCKSHGGVDGKKCADCSAYHGEDVVHGFKHEHLGTIYEKSYVIDKFWNDLVKYTERAMKVRSGEVIPLKKSEKVVEVLEKKAKTKRVIDNPYMNWLAVHRGEIKASLLADNPELGKGRAITVAVTKKAGEIWGGMSNEEKQSWKGKKGVVEADVVIQDEMPPMLEDDVVDSHVSEKTEDSEEEEGIKLLFNDEYKVWVDEETGLYYEKNDVEESPIGQMTNGKPCAFKKAAKKN